MQLNKEWLLALGLLGGMGVAMAAETAVDAPPPPEVLRSGEALEPEVTIRETRMKKVYEYRINGRLVMVRVEPRVGPPYYFVDDDGDGELEYTSDDPTEGPNVNRWVIFRWN